jgi:DNA end-binding protein Ku
MIRGYEIKKGKYVPVTDEELERLAPEKTRDIDLRLFVDQDSIPPIYFERAYFLTPSGDTDKAYRLLAETMEKSGLAGIATFVMRGKEYLVAIFSENGILHAETLRFADELRSPEDVGLPEKKKVPKASVRKFERMIDKKSEQHPSGKEAKDDESERLLKLVKKKLKRGKDVVEVEPERAEDGQVVDIMEVLKKSIAQGR